MTVQEATAVLDAVDTKKSFSVRGLGSGKFGDILLKVVAGLVLLYIFIPIFVIVLFSFNDPKGKFNYSWQGFTLKNWADPFKYEALTDALKAFQTKLGVPVTGTVDAATVAALQEAIAEAKSPSSSSTAPASSPPPTGTSASVPAT